MVGVKNSVRHAAATTVVRRLCLLGGARGGRDL